MIRRIGRYLAGFVFLTYLIGCGGRQDTNSFTVVEPQVSQQETEESDLEEIAESEMPSYNYIDVDPNNQERAILLYNYVNNYGTENAFDDERYLEFEDKETLYTVFAGEHSNRRYLTLRVENKETGRVLIAGDEPLNGELDVLYINYESIRITQTDQFDYEGTIIYLTDFIN